MNIKKLAAGAAMLLMLVGCLGVPDAAQMRASRAESAERIIGDLARKNTTDVGIYLSGPLLLWEAVVLAQANNRPLQQEKLGREIARGRILSSYSEALPTLALTGSFVQRDEELGTTTAGGNYLVTRSRDQSTAGLRLSQPLFNGRVGAALRAAKLYTEWTAASIRVAEERVQAETIRAYYQAVLNENLLEVHQVALETAERQLENAQARRKQGMASNYDELRARVEVANFRAQVLQARNDKDLAYTALYLLIGASPESAVELVDEIPQVAETIEFVAAARVALECRADLAVAEYALRMQRESVALAKGRYWPEVSGYVSQTWANPDPHESTRQEWGDEWIAGVQVSLPLFDGFDRSGSLRQERAKLRQLEVALQDVEERAVSEIRQAVLTLQTAEEFSRSQSQNLETAAEALRLVEAGLKEGQNAPVEVMDARQALTQAAANFYQSAFTHAMSRVALQKAMGRMLPDLLPAEPVLGTGAAAEFLAE